MTVDGETPDSLVECLWRPIGEEGWSAIRTKEIERGAHAFWTDELGVHLTAAVELPLELPPFCTHVWTWSEAALVRLRIDGTVVVGAELMVEPTGDQRFTPVDCRHETGLRLRSLTGASAAVVLSADTQSAWDHEQTFEVWTALPAGSAGIGFMAHSAVRSH
ncbi:MAG: hypothetical protein EBZ67_15465 [Chitinophagia bacterium]|nr:hypothetical protein [Chitinophagia bacterium]